MWISVHVKVAWCPSTSNEKKILIYVVHKSNFFNVFQIVRRWNSSPWCHWKCCPRTRQLVTPFWGFCAPALVDSSPALTLMFNPILTVSFFGSKNRSASHEYPKVCLLDRIIPPFKATMDDSLATKNTLNGSSAFFLCFFHFPLLSLSLPSVFVPMGFR